MGLNFKLDVGTSQLCLQVACQRYRQKSIIAKLFDRVASAVNGFVATFTPRTLAFNAI